MKNWFECKVRFVKIDQTTGKEKKATETYLIDAVSYTEAEVRLHENMKAIISGEFQVKSIRTANYADVFASNDGDTFFKCTIEFVTVDENAGRAKKTKQHLLIPAYNVDEAGANLKKELEGCLVDYSIISISKSPIIEILEYNGVHAEM